MAGPAGAVVGIAYGLLMLAARFGISTPKYMVVPMSRINQFLGNGTLVGTITRAANQAKPVLNDFFLKKGKGFKKVVKPVGSPGWNKEFQKTLGNPEVAGLLKQFMAGKINRMAVTGSLLGLAIAPEIINALIAPELDETAMEEIGRESEWSEEEMAAIRKEDPDVIFAQNLPPPRYGLALHLSKREEDKVKYNVPDSQRKWLYPSHPESSRIVEDRRSMEEDAIREADPEFTEAELAPYTKVAESGFGQKVFGMRRSAPEIERDSTYNQLRQQGLVKEANKFLDSWNAEHKAKLEAVFGESGNLTQFTKDDLDRNPTIAEDIVKKFKKKKRGGRVKPRTKKVIKKMYANGGSVRKPKRI